MDENILNQISDFLSKWGFWQLIAIVLIVILTLVIKIPIKKAAEKYQAKTGIDKSVITWTISVIPFALAFVAALVLDLWGRAWDVNAIEWPTVVKQASVLGGASIGVFEAFKKWAEALTAKKTAAKVEAAKEEATAKAVETAPVTLVEPEKKAEATLPKDESKIIKL